MDRYSFDVGLSHPQLHAGFSRFRLSRRFPNAGAGEVGRERGLVYSRVLTSCSTRDLAVTPTLTLNAATPGHATLVFTGQLDITPLGHPGALIVIETPGPNGWEAVGAPIRVDPRSLQLHLPELPPHFAPHVQIPRRNPRNRPLAQRTHPHSQRRPALTLSSGPLDGDYTRPQRSFASAHDRQFDRHRCHHCAPHAWANLAPASRAPVPRHRPYLTDVDTTRTILSRRLCCASRLAIVAAGYRIVMIRNHRVSIRTGGRLH